MTNLEKIMDMLNKQDELNCLTSGDDWKSNVTNKGKTINWLRCIRREAMELCDSYPWEHWKSLDKEPDIDNALIELTDIWFFIMSHLLMKHNIIDNKLAEDVLKCLNIKILTIETNVPDLTDDLIRATNENHIHTISEIEYSYLIYKFVKLMKALDVDVDFLYELYNGKLMLNKFRQDNGYKEGTYSKVWNGKEDNVHMLEIIRTNKNINNEAIYDALNSRYSLLMEVI